ncbi:hypothetical protein JKP88DRAFT_241336 [Tribonema minus]|uniref:Uncharacterized protein n=1 Tax=Tribonema minus TaxID=303371 RepID=A0A836CEY1_9STRA|nr:hypothetical protein JKP88DRAFT_241336 [Tribonema minus]
MGVCLATGFRHGTPPDELRRLLGFQDFLGSHSHFSLPRLTTCSSSTKRDTQSLSAMAMTSLFDDCVTKSAYSTLLNREQEFISRCEGLVRREREFLKREDRLREKELDIHRVGATVQRWVLAMVLAVALLTNHTARGTFRSREDDRLFNVALVTVIMWVCLVCTWGSASIRAVWCRIHSSARNEFVLSELTRLQAGIKDSYIASSVGSVYDMYEKLIKDDLVEGRTVNAALGKH